MAVTMTNLSVARCGLSHRQPGGQLPLVRSDRQRHGLHQTSQQPAGPHGNPQRVLHGQQHQLPVCRNRECSVAKSVLSVIMYAHRQQGRE